jgi:hypothetical protein
MVKPNFKVGDCRLPLMPEGPPGAAGPHSTGNPAVNKDAVKPSTSYRPHNFHSLPFGGDISNGTLQLPRALPVPAPQFLLGTNPNALVNLIQGFR